MQFGSEFFLGRGHLMDRTFRREVDSVLMFFRDARIGEKFGAIEAADPNNRLEYMKAIVQTANVEGETIPLREVILFWFAVSSPLLGMLLGLLGAWFVTWLSA